MALLTTAFASSHGIMINAGLEDWLGRFEEFDRLAPLVDPEGRTRTYDDLLASAPKEAASQIAPDAIRSRYSEARDAIAKLKGEVEDSALDALIVIGDDQSELLDERNMPIFGVYYGETIRNRAQPETPPKDWMDATKRRRLEISVPRDYPVHSQLARHLIAGLMEDDFDVAALRDIDPAKGESHAFAYVHRYLMADRCIPIVPVFLNSFYPPNQPSPRRCLALGRAIAKAVASFPGNGRVGVFASGGLSHFVLDEKLDRDVIEAFRQRDYDRLLAIPTRNLQSGNSEIRNWICMAGALGELRLDWATYIPGYRTPALTGTGLCFARWR